MLPREDRGMDGMGWMASAMSAARRRLEIASHDLANASSDGFRRAAIRVGLTEHGMSVATSTSREQGAVRATGRPFDLALLGEGTFRVDGGTTRSGAFERDRDGWIVDDRGRRLHGTRGPLRVSERGSIDADGAVRDGERIVDRLPLPRGTTLRAGGLEASNVDAIGTTLQIVEAQRAFETAQKVFVALDTVRQKAADDVGRLK